MCLINSSVLRQRNLHPLKDLKLAHPPILHLLHFSAPQLPMPWPRLDKVFFDFLQRSAITQRLLETQQMQPGITVVFVELGCPLEELSRFVELLFYPKDFADCDEDVGVCFAVVYCVS